MNEPQWVTLEDCMSTHALMLDRFGGMDGVRDAGLLESALERPRNLWAYESPTIFDLAAAYAHGIVKNHPYLDGNKRSGFIMAALFLVTNGYQFKASEPEAVLMTVDLAAGKIDSELYARWLEQNSGRVED